MTTPLRAYSSRVASLAALDSRILIGHALERVTFVEMPPPRSHLDRQDRLFRFLLDRYGFVVQISSGACAAESELSALREGVLLLHRNNGLLDAEIFICAHVFGHVVQLSTTTRYDALVALTESHRPPLRLPGDVLGDYWDFEIEAYRIGLGLMIEAIGCDDDLRRRYLAYMRTDMRNYFGYLETGRTLSPRQFVDLFDLEAAQADHDLDLQFSPIGIPGGDFVHRKVRIDVV